MKLKIKDLVNLTKNSRTNQNSLNIKKNELKKFGLDIDDLLNLPINKKIKDFERRFD